MFPVAVIVNGKIVEITQHVGRPIERPYAHALANIAGRPDLKVGDSYPPCTMAEAIATGRLVRTPTKDDPFAVSVPSGAKKGGE